MRTNIVIDDQLMADAIKLSGAKTKREVVELALRRLVASVRQKDILDLVGQDLIAPDYEVRAARPQKKINKPVLSLSKDQHLLSGETDS